MQRLIFKIRINALPPKVWDCLWNPDNYKKWTNPFSSGSYYKTESFSEGSIIHFLTPSGDGMYSVIHKLKKHEYLEFKHLGNVKNFKELPQDLDSMWTNATESYQLLPALNSTELIVNVDMPDEYADHMTISFKKALNILKSMAEINN